MKNTYNLTAALLLSVLIIGGCSITKKPEASNDGLTDDTVIAGDELGELSSDVEIIKEDVYGKDLDFTERYPGALRSYYESYESETTVTYQTTDTVQAVRDFYTSKLQESGWKLEGDGTDFTEFSRSTDAGDEYLSVYYYDYQSTQGIIEFELYLEKLGADSADEEE